MCSWQLGHMTKLGTSQDVEVNCFSFYIPAPGDLSQICPLAAVLASGRHGFELLPCLLLLRGPTSVRWGCWSGWRSVLSARLAHSSSHQWTISSPPALGLLPHRHVKCRKPVVLSASVTSAVTPWTLMEEIVQWFTALSELKLKQLWSTGIETSGIHKGQQAIPDRAEDQKLLRHRQGLSKMFLGVYKTPGPSHSPMWRRSWWGIGGAPILL